MEKMKKEILEILQEQANPESSLINRSVRLKLDIQEIMSKINDAKININYNKKTLEISAEEKKKLELRRVELLKRNDKLKKDVYKKNNAPKPVIEVISEENKLDNNKTIHSHAKMVKNKIAPIAETVGIDWDDAENDLDPFLEKQEPKNSIDTNISVNKKKAVYGKGVFIPNMKQ